MIWGYWGVLTGEFYCSNVVFTSSRLYLCASELATPPET